MTILPKPRIVGFSDDDEEDDENESQKRKVLPRRRRIMTDISNRQDSKEIENDSDDSGGDIDSDSSCDWDMIRERFD